jgi:hypothetical protein
VSLVTATMSTRLQQQLGELIAKGGLHREQAKKASRVAAGVVDDHGRQKFRSHAYRYGSTKKALEDRVRWRDWASKKASLRFQTKKSGTTDFWHRSMVKYANGGVGNPSPLSHLIEFGSFNHRTRRYNRASKIKRQAFRDRQRMAMIALEKGLALAVQNASTGTRMGLVQFRKTVV